MYYLNEDLENIHKKDPISHALSYLPSYSYFPATSRKTRYYYELMLYDTSSCAFIHKFRGDNLSYHQIPYHYETFESCIAYSKAIIMKILSYDDYSNPNATRKLSNVVPPPGIPYEYNY